MDSLIQRMSKIRGKIESEMFWKSNEIEKYFEDCAKTILKKYGSSFNIVIKIIYLNNDTIANTSFDKITLNAGCPQVKKCNTIERQFLYLKGLMAHELSHILYLDRKQDNYYQKTLLNGKWYPFVPKECDSDIVDEISRYIKDKRNAKIFTNIALNMSNIVEDGYGEKMYLLNYYGSLTEGLVYMRKEFQKDLCDIAEIENKYIEENKKNKINCVFSIILQYCLYSEIKCIDSSKEYTVMSELEKSKNILNKILKTHSTRQRFELINILLVIYWDYMKIFMTEPEQEQEENSEKEEDKKENSKEKDSNSNSEESDNSNNNEKSDSKGDNNQCSDNPENLDLKSFMGMEKPERGEGNTIATGTTNVEIQIDETKEPLKNIQHQETNMSNDFYELFESVVKEIAQQQLEKEALIYCNKEANNGSYKGAEIFLERDVIVTNEMMHEYSKYEEYLIISKRMQKIIKQKLKDERNGGKRSNLYLGRKVEVRNIIKNDGKCFYNNKLPKETPRIVVFLILDESASMGKSCKNGNSRIENAKITSIILEDFCRELGFPISIIGSTADYQQKPGNSELKIYSSFNSIDKNDKYRLTEIKKKSCNRDGAALEYAYSQLVKRPEEIKILFIISDGQPNAHNYGGAVALNELKKIKEYYDKKNIITFAAAVGEDKEKIEKIYDESFLDISDIEILPKIFIDKIIKFLKR